MLPTCSEHIFLIFPLLYCKEHITHFWIFYICISELKEPFAKISDYTVVEMSIIKSIRHLLYNRHFNLWRRLHLMTATHNITKYRSHSLKNMHFINNLNPK